MFKPTITDEEINELPILSFDGTLHLIRSDADVQRACDFLSEYKELGFDTESKPSYVKGQKNSVALLQLSTNEDAFIFQLKYLHKYSQIFQILENPEIAKIGVAISNDFHELRHLKDLKEQNFIELQKYVKKFNIENLSLKKISAIVLNGKISKRQQRSNWSLANLSEAQIKYAATDAWASLLIYQTLKKAEEFL